MLLFLRRFALAFYCFLFIFNPTNFFDFNLFYVYFLVAILFLVFDLALFKKVFLQREVFFVFFILAYLVAYLLVWYLFSGSQDALYRAYTYILLLMSLFCAVFICIYFLKLFDGNINDFISFLFLVGFIQIVFVILSIVVPEFRDWVISTSRNEKLDQVSNQAGLIRTFGLANGYTSYFPMLMGVFAFFCILKAIKKDMARSHALFFIFLSVLFFISGVVNARIAAVPVFLFIILYGVSGLIVWKRFFLIFVVCAPSALIVWIILTFFGSELFARVAMGLDQVLNLASGNVSGIFSVLLKMLYFPDVYSELIFGTGFTPFGKGENGRIASDIGLVRDVYILGIVNMVLLAGSFVPLCYQVFLSAKQHYGHLAFWVLALSVLFFYLKGAILGYSELYSFLLLLAICSMLIRRRIGFTQKVNQ